MDKWIDNHGVPKRILTDQGKQYISKKFTTLSQKIQLCMLQHQQITQRVTQYQKGCKTLSQVLRIFK